MEKINRRDFLKLVGAGSVGTGAGFLWRESTKMTTELLLPQVVPPEDYSPGIATWYNTVCGQCGAGCGISVRTREGRAKKIEGNPVHPVNQGGLCALGQAGLNVLYNPDRISAPLKRVGERGSGEFAETTWDEAMTTLSGRLSTLRIADRGGQVGLLSGGAPGHLDHLFDEFMKGIGSSRYVLYDFTHPHALVEANRRAFGAQRMPYYDIANTAYLLSFGADYLGTWISPVHHSVGYGEMRQGGGRSRGRCVQIEPRMSLSGANADEWIPARPGSEGLLALAMANEIVNHQGYNGVDRQAWIDALAPYDPAAVAEKCDVEEGTIRRLAKEFISYSPSLAIGGGAAANAVNGVANLVAINVLNHLVGNLNNAGGILFNAEPAFGAGAAARYASYARLMEFGESIRRGEVDTVLLHECNPVHTLPAGSGFRDALLGAPFVVALASFVDETSVLADLILPVDSYLESWGDSVPEPGVGIRAATIAQPVVARLHNTLAAGDIVLQLGHQIGGDLPRLLPWDSYQDFLRESLNALYKETTGDATAEGFDRFWHEVLQSGVWGVSTHAAQLSSANLLASLGSVEPEFEGGEAEYPFYLQPYLTAAFHDGRGANLPWMQELPDPLTSIVYHTWVELNPETARKLDVEEGDVLAIESTGGKIEVPVFIYPAVRPDVVAIPIGQGHTQFGRYAKDRGANALSIVAPRVDEASGALAWGASRVKVSATGKHVKLPRTAGNTRTLGRQILVTDHPHTPDYM